MGRLDSIRDEIRALIERVGDQSLAELGFLLSEVRENRGEHLERACRDLVRSSLLQGISADEALTLLVVAIGADAARVAYESGALGDAVLEGAKSEDVADIAADSIAFDEFVEERVGATRKALEATDIPMSVARSDDDRLRMACLARESYRRFVAHSVEEELAEQGTASSA